jgi:hypothetical protein
MALRPLFVSALFVVVHALGWAGGLSLQAPTAWAQSKPKEEIQSRTFYGPGRVVTPFIKSPGHVKINYAYELSIPFSIKLQMRDSPTETVEILKWDGPQNTGKTSSRSEKRPRIVLKGSEKLDLSGEFRLEISGDMGWVVSVQTSKRPDKGE